MEELKYPIIIKKKNWFMITVGISEIVFSLTCIIQEGITSLGFWALFAIGLITLLTVWVEYSRDIHIEKNKIEFYKNKVLQETINYSEINELSIINGEENKDKNKKFLAIYFKTKENKKYLISRSDYGIDDLVKLRDTILKYNSKVKISEEVKKMGNEK